MASDVENTRRASWMLPGVSTAVAITICMLAVQATWNMSNGLSSIRLDNQKALADTAASISQQGESLRLQIQELQFQVKAQGDQIKEIRESQKMHTEGR